MTEDPFWPFGRTAEGVVREMLAGRTTGWLTGRANGRKARAEALAKAFFAVDRADAEDRSFENETKLNPKPTKVREYIPF